MEGAALELAVAGEGRLLLAVQPPAGTKQQPVTLGMLQVSTLLAFMHGSCESLWRSKWVEV